MLKRIRLIMILTIIIVFSFTALASATTFIRIATGGSGGNYYRIGAGMASLWNDLFPDLQVSIQATGGSGANVDLIADKEVEIAFVGANPAYEAYNNLGQWADRPEGRYKDMRFVSHGYPNPENFLAMEWAPEIKNMRDLKGKRVSIGMIGSNDLVYWEQILQVLGWTMNDIIPEYTVHQACIDQVRNRQIDAVFWTDAAGSASITEIMETGFARFIDIDEDVVEAMTKDTLDFPFTIPPGSFPNQDQPVKTFAGSAIMIAHKDVPDDIVYDLIKSTYENQDFLIDIHPIIEYMVLEQALNGQPFELHPGAEKYYREMGVLK